AAPSPARSRRALDRELRSGGAPGGGARRSATLADRDGRRMAGRARPPHGCHHAARRGGVVAAGVQASRAHGDVAGGRRVDGAAISTWVSNRGGVGAVRTVDQIVIWAPLARAFPVAAQVERWPEILPHYRWVRFLDRSDRGGTVEMAAWRPFGLLRYPVWWVSEMAVDRTACEVRYRHVRGITAGMSVVWRLVPHAPGGTAQPDGVLVPVVAEWQGLTARRSAVREITRFDPTPFKSRIAAEIPDFRPQDHLNAKRVKRLDRFSQLAVTSARLALADAELDPGREDGDRVGAMMGSALGGVAFAEAQVGGFQAQGPRGLDPALALAVFAGAASCNI